MLNCVATDDVGLMSINDIINGKPAEFPGLIPLINSYLETMNIDVSTRCHLGRYLSLISMRASGELKTAAAWIRAFVQSHEAYKFDSQVSEPIAYDLLKSCADIGRGARECPELFGNLLRTPRTTQKTAH